MPYIHPNDRHHFDAALANMPTPLTAGELNYVFTRLAKRYVRENGDDYQARNDVLGAFDGAAKEFYRRDVAPYEDRKIEQNGDVD